jgi:ubiquinone/menaquinone biosynthesis C-methylase UbiE
MGEYPGLDADFRERYRIVTDPTMLRAERKVIGGDYGASSYTTMAQADELAGCLALGPGRTILDIGSGSGWPGSYLAASTGCTAIITDPTLEGMAVANERSQRDGLDTTTVVATGTALPFKGEVFDASTSSDVFC